MNFTRYGLPLLAFFTLTSFLLIMRSTLLEKISTIPDSVNGLNYASFNTDEVLSLIFREFTHRGLVKKTQQKAVNEAESPAPVAPRKMCSYTREAKKAALQQLEDVLLEPPRAASGKSRKYLKRTRFLPDLMGDSLESYPRHVFIEVELSEKEGGSGKKWFTETYPTRNKQFEMYDVKTVMAEEMQQNEEIGMSDWLRKNVKEEEFVVMKAEAEVVEDMMRSDSIGLVDELFLECKPKRGGKKEDSSRRAYWECLALYGKLRDEGVAVHQWWG
ncbi:unnamed protein product [Sphenostylis stenocarpa]|uniref:DUF7870 domain-containing protein n=1 Tax=Sphenostylis stenocarpa TaxID=92480 RepID=A0AA86SW99_9FABA|nr:unnamed protein product [Sphenostylis stenocarpa]